MYSAEPLFNVPDESTTIWRYMDFTKFVSMLVKGALYFTRSDKFEDKFEGTIPKPTIKAREVEVQGLQTHLAEEVLKEWSLSSRKVREWIFVNCWHINSTDSVSMWELYGKKNNGIAIQSTFARLRYSLPSRGYNIQIGMVNYIDYDRDIIPFGNAFHALFCKKRNFVHEQELRAAFLKPSITNDIPPGLNISCNLNTLIDKIFVSPDSPDWFKELVSSILEKYSLDIEVKRSNLDEDPLF